MKEQIMLSIILSLQSLYYGDSVPRHDFRYEPTHCADVRLCLSVTLTLFIPDLVSAATVVTSRACGCFV